MSLQEIADCIKGGVGADADGATLDRFLSSCTAAAADLGIEYFLDSGLNTYQAAVVVRGNVLDRVAAILDTYAVALSRGFLLPDPPFATINSVNTRRRIFEPLGLPSDQQQRMLGAAKDLSEVTAGYQDGTITFERAPGFQLGSYEVSVDGLAPQTGDPLADILGYQPDGDFIKRKRALDSLAKLDFGKRQPYLLFTADLDGGALVCWSRMHDASGYKLRRRDVFAMVDLPDVTLDNDRLRADTQALMADDRFYQMLTFYDWLDHEDVLAYVDRSLSPDTLYSFDVSGLQKKAPGSPFVFDVPTSALFMSPALADQVSTLVSEESARFNRQPAQVSPYPALAQAIYGDPGYGWMLAGVNMLAAVRRGDGADAVRALGFIGSTVDGLLSAGRAGRLVLPQDPGAVPSAVDGSVGAYGVSQTMVSILDGLGLTEFIAGKDDPKGISTADLIDRSTSTLSRILSVIDPATATVDPGLLVTSLMTKPPTNERPAFVRVVPNASPAIPIEEVVGTGLIDLTTYAGISRLVQVLRAVYDFYPGALS